jgi:hypothetical protein
MAETKDIYVLGQSETGSIVNLGEEIRIDLALETSVQKDVGTLYGNIQDADGNPIENVTVKITDNLFNPLYHRNTDENGNYTINNIPADNQYEVVAQKDLYDLGIGTSFVMQAEQMIERKFTLVASQETNTAIVAGEIMTTDDERVADVAVALYDNSQPESPVLLKTTYTNQYGQFAFFYIPAGLYKIECKKLGYTTASNTFVVDSSTQMLNIEVDMEVDPVTRKGTVNGVIRDEEGSPVASAFVILYTVTQVKGEEVLTPVRKTITNGDGLYLFEQVSKGDYKIKANKTELVD